MTPKHFIGGERMERHTGRLLRTSIQRIRTIWWVWNLTSGLPITRQ